MSERFERIADEVLMATLLAYCYATPEDGVLRELFVRRLRQLKALGCKLPFKVHAEYLKSAPGAGVVSEDEDVFLRKCLSAGTEERFAGSPKIARVTEEVVERYMAHEVDVGYVSTLRSLEKQSALRKKQSKMEVL